MSTTAKDMSDCKSPSAFRDWVMWVIHQILISQMSMTN